jgi:hypothetical protein
MQDTARTRNERAEEKGAARKGERAAACVARGDIEGHRTTRDLKIRNRPFGTGQDVEWPYSRSEVITGEEALTAFDQPG